MLNVRLTSAGRWNISASFLAAYTLRPFKPELDAKRGPSIFPGRIIYIYIYISNSIGNSEQSDRIQGANGKTRSLEIVSMVWLLCYIDMLWASTPRRNTWTPDVCGSWWKFFCRDINFVYGGIVGVIVSCIRDGKFKVCLLLVRFFLDVHVVWVHRCSFCIIVLKNVNHATETSSWIVQLWNLDVEQLVSLEKYSSFIFFVK